MKYTWAQIPGPIRRAINNYVNAKINDSWKGGGDPENYTAIEEYVKEARQILIKTLIKYAVDMIPQVENEELDLKNYKKDVPTFTVEELAKKLKKPIKVIEEYTK